MQPSSLIFLVIVAIWVAYLIQHWVRRREHLATARSVDRFSEAMRVLERRSPLPSTMLATASTGSRSGSSGSGGSVGSAGSSARPTPSAGTPSGERPEVVVKRASVSSPLRARTGARGDAGPVHEVPPIELVPHRTTAQIVLRRVRGILFLAALVAVPATITLSAMHILKWLSVGVAVGALVVVLGWLRIAAIRDQKARRARRAELRRLERLRASGSPRSAVGSAGSGGGSGSTSRGATAAKRPPAQPVRPSNPAPTRTPEVGSQPVVASASESGSEFASESVSQPAPLSAAVADVDPDAWQPVPVPPPTYTLKDAAHRPEPSARRAREDDAGMRPVPIEVEDDEIEIMAATQGRRVVGH